MWVTFLGPMVRGFVMSAVLVVWTFAGLYLNGLTQ